MLRIARPAVLVMASAVIVARGGVVVVRRAVVMVVVRVVVAVVVNRIVVVVVNGLVVVVVRVVVMRVADRDDAELGVNVVVAMTDQVGERRERRGPQDAEDRKDGGDTAARHARATPLARAVHDRPHSSQNRALSHSPRVRPRADPGYRPLTEVVEIR